MGMEALQQMILQRPQLIGYGIGQARDEAQERRLFEMQRSGQLVEGILQAIGLAVEQQRFNEQMAEGKRQFNVQEGIQPQMGRVGMGGIGAYQPPGYRAQEAERAAEVHGWNRAVEGSPEVQEAARNARILETLGLDLRNQGMRQDLGFNEATEAARRALVYRQAEGAGIQNEAGRQGLRQNEQMFPLQFRGAQLGNQAAEQGLERGALDIEAAKAQQDWLKRFQAVPDDASRFEMIGQDPDAWLQLQLTGMEVSGRQAAADAKIVPPQDYAVEELTKAFQKYNQLATVGAEGLVSIQSTQQEKAREMGASLMGLMNQIRSGALAPLPGESKEAFLGRALSMLGRGATPTVGVPGSNAAGEDLTAPPR